MIQDKLLCWFGIGRDRRRSPHPDGMTLGMYLDGELPKGRTASVEAHLEACASCRDEVQLLAALGEEFRDMADPVWDVEAMVCQAMAEVERVEALRASDSAKAGRVRSAGARRRAMVPLAAAVAVLVMFAASISSSAFRRSLAEQDKALIRSHYMISSSHVGGTLDSNSARVIRVSVPRPKLVKEWR
ncbi:MAG: zf-HC2 domain-containing protein [Bacillota bacterium]|jgi:anti-sigma factor RsiW|nr:zf-HC2 domain-containing protein [Bacillota bacterium]